MISEVDFAMNFLPRLLGNECLVSEGALPEAVLQFVHF